MQGQRGKMVSLPETFEIDRTSSSSGATIDQQLCWNDMRGPPETHFSGFMLPPNDSSIPFMDSIGQEQRNLNGYSLGEASSSSGPYRSSNSEWKVENGWPSTVGRHGPRIEDQRYGPSNGALSLDNASINPMFVQGSVSSSFPPNIISTGEYVGPSGENPPLMEYPNLYKSGGSSNNQRFPIPPGSQADPLIPSGSGGYVREESEVRLGGSFDGRRVPCKRKSFEGHVGQSSLAENPNFPQPMESSLWHATPPCFNMSSGPAAQQLPEQVAPRLALDLAGGAVARGLPDMESAEISHRNFRLRVNSSGQNDLRSTSLPPSALAAAGSPGVISAPQSSSRLLVTNRSLELPPPLALNGSAPQGPQPLLQVPAMAPGGHSVRWSRGLVPRTNGFSPSIILPDEASSSGGSRNMLQHSMFVPNVSSLSARGLASAGSSGFQRNADSAPRASSSSAAPQLPHHGSAPQPNHHHSRYPRRLSEYVRRQLLSTIGSDSAAAQGSQTSNSSGRPVLSQDVLLSSGPGSSSHRHSLSRSAFWMERQGDSVVGFPYPVRTLSASEGRRRLASEKQIRSVLELVRRGEGGFRVE
ncbi:hypothetical protein CRG98_009872, partial [Punica granatum]